MKDWHAWAFIAASGAVALAVALVLVVLWLDCAAVGGTLVRTLWWVACLRG